jgi:hypothetical protein
MQFLQVVPVDLHTRQRAFNLLFDASELIRHPLDDVKLGYEFEMSDLSSSRTRYGSISDQFAMTRYLEKPEATMHRPARHYDKDCVDVNV